MGHQSARVIFGPLYIAVAKSRACPAFREPGRISRAKVLALVSQPLLVAIPFEGRGHTFPQRSLSLKSELGGRAGRIANPVALPGVENLVTREDAGASSHSRQQ